MNRPPVLERALTRLEKSKENAAKSKLAEVIARHIQEQQIGFDWNPEEKFITIYKPYKQKIH